MSHLTRGAWIEIGRLRVLPPFVFVSHLTRGAWIEIKIRLVKSIKPYTSHLTRGAWIEMIRASKAHFIYGLSHLTRGAWIEISLLRALMHEFLRRTSHEVRGLKSETGSEPIDKIIVAPHTRCVD